MTGDTAPLLDKADIERALRRLGERLDRRGIVADLYVFGGAAMALAYDARRATRDIDALMIPHGVVHDEARAVAAELGLPPWWLNEQASVYTSASRDGAARSMSFPGLRVAIASAEHLLAMKVLAARRRDVADLRILVDELGLVDAEGVLAVVRRVFPDEAVPERAVLALEDVFAPEQ